MTSPSPYHTAYQSIVRATEMQPAGCVLVQEEDEYGRAVGEAFEFSTYAEAVQFIQDKQHSPWLNGPAHGPRHAPRSGEALWFTDVYTQNGRFIRSRTWRVLCG